MALARRVLPFIDLPTREGHPPKSVGAVVSPGPLIDAAVLVGDLSHAALLSVLKLALVHVAGSVKIPPLAVRFVVAKLAFVHLTPGEAHLAEAVVLALLVHLPLVAPLLAALAPDEAGEGEGRENVALLEEGFDMQPQLGDVALDLDFQKKGDC
jgi:hypothetical protein